MRFSCDSVLLVASRKATNLPRLKITLITYRCLGVLRRVSDESAVVRYGGECGLPS